MTTVNVTEGILAKLYDITVQQGSDFNLTVLYKDSSGSPITTLDGTAELQARSWSGSSSKIIELDESDGLTIDASKGEITIFIAAATTAALTAPSNLVYDLEAGLDTDLKVRLMEGQCLVSANVTR